MEIWKDIKGYEGLYQVSNLGRVKSLSRYIFASNGIRKSKERILKQAKARSGGKGKREHKSVYYVVGLSKNSKSKTFRTHRLVAETFLQKIEGKSQVNHKDLNKLNNKLSNLEWCSHKENIDHSRKNRKIKTRAKKLVMLDSHDNILLCFYSTILAAKYINGYTTHIINVCNKRGYSKTAYGYKWQYVK